MEMKVIMDNWRKNMADDFDPKAKRIKSKLISEGKKKQDLFSDYEYITVILGVNVPLSENKTFSLSASQKKKILQEQALLEGAITSLAKTGMKSFTIYSILDAFTGLFSMVNSTLVKMKCDSLKKELSEPLLTLIESLDKVKENSPLANGLSATLSVFKGWVDSVQPTRVNLIKLFIATVIFRKHALKINALSKITGTGVEIVGKISNAIKALNNGGFTKQLEAAKDDNTVQTPKSAVGFVTSALKDTPGLKDFVIDRAKDIIGGSLKTLAQKKLGKGALGKAAGATIDTVASAVADKAKAAGKEEPRNRRWYDKQGSKPAEEKPEDYEAEREKIMGAGGIDEGLDKKKNILITEKMNRLAGII